ncbi:Hint domain-containing protein [Microvirga sp. TS319]|uniref:Hint domain-containing protein n=1 Tax=Microvirga sp. TS319 TaxID=3241165 RepID=UPI00351A9E2D
MASTVFQSSAQAKNDNGLHLGQHKGEGRPRGHGHGPQCFLRGTAILTPTGEVPIEALQIGDLVVTAGGTVQPIKWIGRQIYRKSGAAWPRSVVPIRIARAALGARTPHADLYLSPGHALLLDGLLIPAQALVNGTSIAPALPDGRAEIEYFNLLFDTHVAILAEGAAAETFLPDGRNHEGFSNFLEYERLYPGQPPPRQTPCAPAVARGGRAHLQALVLLGLSRILPEQDPMGDVYEHTYQHLARRAQELAG